VKGIELPVNVLVIIAVAVLVMLGLIAIMYGFSSFSQLHTILSAGLLLVGAVGILAFIKWEMKVRHPILDISLFKNNRVFAFSILQR
jgi:hypothetical protein